MHHLLSTVMIMFGAVVLLFSIVTAKDLNILTPFIPESSRTEITRSLKLHRAMMLFFLVGYLAVAVAFFFRIAFLGELFIGVVFLLGAIFVLIGLRLQTRMLLEIKGTLQGLLPICASCKKIRLPEGDPHDSSSWQTVEKFISTKANVDFTHSVCPDCLKRLYPELYQ